MKYIILTLSLLAGTASFALEENRIQGKDAAEIVNVLTNTLNVQIDPRGDSPETMCYGVKSYRLKGLECITASCTPEGRYEIQQVAECSLENIEGQSELKKIRAILKKAGLNPSNSLFHK